MRPTHLEKLRWNWRDHKSVLWWLGILYRRPLWFLRAWARLHHLKTVNVIFFIYLNALPYIFLLCVIAQLLIIELLKIPLKEILGTHEQTIFAYLSDVISGILIGIVSGSFIGIGASFRVLRIIHQPSMMIPGGIFLGIVWGIVFGTFLPLSHLNIWNYAILCVISFSILYPFRITKFSIGGTSKILNGILVGVVCGILWGIDGRITRGIIGGIVCVVLVLRVYYHIFYWWLLWPKPLGRLYRFHPVAWDDLCIVPFPRLDRLLMAYTEYVPEAGKREIERMIQSYPSQRHAALKAKTILLARQTAHEKNFANLGTLLAPMPEGEKGFLSETRRLREMVNEIARIQTRLNTVSRPVLREPVAQMLHERIENFRHQIGGFQEPLASEFRNAATQWLELARKQVQEAQAILRKELSPVVFRSGDPVNREQEAFVPRHGVLGDLDKQIMLSTGCPGLVLYGRRRMGKSTVLHNLNGFLPDTVIPVVISMQDPQAFTSLADLLNLISQKLTAAVGGETGNAADEINLNLFMQRLSESNKKLQAAGKRVLLAIDEYENLDRKLGEKIFPEDLLAAVRESIQTHRHLTWIFAGSHDITELRHAA